MIRQAATTGQNQILLGLWVSEQPFCQWFCEASLTALAAGLLPHCQAPLPPAYRQATLCLSRSLVISSDLLACQYLVPGPAWMSGKYSKAKQSLCVVLKYIEEAVW